MATAEIDITDDAPALQADEPLPTPEQLGIFDPFAGAETLKGKACVLELHVHASGWTRSMDPREIMDPKYLKEIETLTEADVENGVKEPTSTRVNPKRIRAAKDIIDRKELKPMHDFMGAKVNWIKQQCHVTSKILRGGCYIMPLVKLDQINNVIKELEEGIKMHLDLLEPKYPAIIEAAKVDLGPKFNPNDYLTFDVIREQYGVDWQYISYNVPEQLASLNKEIFEEAVQRNHAKAVEMTELLCVGMRANFLKLVDHLKDVLGKDEEGKPKRFHASVAENLKTFCKTIGDKDVVNDLQLRALTAQAEELLEGIDPKLIRSDEALRDALEKKFTQIVETTKSMVQPRERKLELTADI